MPKKLKVSASQINKVRQCKRLYAFEYVEKLRPPSSPKQQFGLDVHDALEKWIKESKLPDDSAAGRMAKMAITKKVIPAPDKKLLAEEEFTFAWNDRVDVGGFLDLQIPPELLDSGVPIVTDYKTTSDLRWAKSRLQLSQDAQAILYSIKAMFTWTVQKVVAKWIYLVSTAPKSGNRKPTGVKPVIVEFDAHDPEFQKEVRAIDSDIEEIYRIRSLNIRGLSLPPSPEACEDFGGCFHKGRCNLSPEDKLGSFMEREEKRHNRKDETQ